MELQLERLVPAGDVLLRQPLHDRVQLEVEERLGPDPLLDDGLAVLLEDLVPQQPQLAFSGVVPQNLDVGHPAHCERVQLEAADGLSSWRLASECGEETAHNDLSSGRALLVGRPDQREPALLVVVPHGRLLLRLFGVHHFFQR